MKNNQLKKYLIQCKCCGHMLSKTQIGIFFNTQIECSRCQKILDVPEMVVITPDKNKKNKKIYEILDKTFRKKVKLNNINNK